MSEARMHRRTLIPPTAIFIAVVLAAGCTSKSDRGLAVRTVDTTAFANGDPLAESPESSDSSSSVSVTYSAQTPSNVTTTASPTSNAGDASPPSADSPTTSAAPPESAPSASTSSPERTPSPESGPARIRPGEQLMKPDDVVVIDSVIGQVSGRPIFADALLEPIADLLRREAERLEAREFTTRAQQIIMERLREVVLSELFIAEAEASLTPDQQMGLMAFLQDLQEKTIASGQGSRTVTQERLMEELNMTIEQYTERERHTLLIQHLINKKISPRVIVSWKDVQREYERKKDEFNPPATITYQRITLFKDSDAERVQQVSDMFAAGESFERAVDAAGAENVAIEGPFTLGPDGVGDQDVNEAIRPHLKGLEVGQTSAPIELGRRIMWWHVKEKVQPPPQSLYQVQRGLINELTIRRENEERERYIRTMFAKGMHDELNDMLRRAMTVALLRYGK